MHCMYIAYVPADPSGRGVQYRCCDYQPVHGMKSFTCAYITYSHMSLILLFLLNFALISPYCCQADPGAMSMFGPVIKPVGGHVLGMVYYLCIL